MRSSKTAISLCLMALAALVVACAPGGPASGARKEKALLALGSPSIFVFPGAAAEATAYYKRIQTRLAVALLDGADAPRLTLTELLEYFGYRGLTAGDLESIESAALMPATQTEFDKLAQSVADPATFAANFTLASLQGDKLLVSRFFAPKIVDYTKPPPYVPGWRKLVRLDPRPGSPAANAGIASAYVLFNHVKADNQVDPFKDNQSKNNQVILVPQSFNGQTEDSVFFMVFKSGAEGYKLGLALEGVAFDLPSVPGTGTYYVPGACAQCHGHDGSGPAGPKPSGGVFRFARLNYLDTDQWHDAVRFDFAQQFQNSPNAVVFDGGTDVAAPAYAQAMGVLRKINQHVQVQNAVINPSDFKVKAAEKWLANHSTNLLPVAQEQRILDLGGAVWDTQDADQRELLTHLNHFCFRCHSSIRYNVFDKEGVAEASAGFRNRLKERAVTDPRYMPNGRELDPRDRDRIIELADKLFP